MTGLNFKVFLANFGVQELIMSELVSLPFSDVLMTLCKWIRKWVFHAGVFILSSPITLNWWFDIKPDHLVQRLTAAGDRWAGSTWGGLEWLNESDWPIGETVEPQLRKRHFRGDVTPSWPSLSVMDGFTDEPQPLFAHHSFFFLTGVCVRPSLILCSKCDEGTIKWCNKLF